MFKYHVSPPIPRRLLDMASGPEAFFSIRSQFARSLSAFSAAAYILGIGDRHLGNFLIDQTDGTVVGIDFGLAFGCGLGLPVPELIPFRMTRQVLMRADFRHVFFSRLRFCRRY